MNDKESLEKSIERQPGGYFLSQSNSINQRQHLILLRLYLPAHFYDSEEIPIANTSGTDQQTKKGTDTKNLEQKRALMRLGKRAIMRLGRK